MMKFRYALLISLGLHFAAVQALDWYADEIIRQNIMNLLNGLNGKKGGAKDGSRFVGVTTRDIPPRQIVSVEVYTPPEKGGERKKSKKDKDCPNGYYEGIGLESSGQNGKEIVTKVFEGYPAWNADIRPGDEIVRIDQLMIAGPKGTVVVMFMQRNGITVPKPVTRDKICY